ncbi:MAG TPA: hypothetical protein VFC00_20080 [Micromonosporaceae bacterium]|nr:hypothetical protein [Micromonosporaceae bacterium]
MSKELIARLQAELAQLTDPARLPVLVRLGQAYMAEYTNIGPGSPAAKPDLDASIEALAEAYGYLGGDDAIKGQVAAILGFQLTARYTAHGGADRDCQTGISVLEDALSSPSLSAPQRAMTQIALGQLYVARVSAYMQTTGFGAQARSGGAASADALADVDRASACFRAVLDGEPVGDEFTTFARTLLDVAEAVRAMLGAVSGGLSGFDLNSLMSTFAMLQKLQDQMKQGGPPGYRLPATGFFTPGLATLAALDPLDRPVAVIQGRQAVNDPAPTIQRSAPPPQPAPDELRRSLYALLPSRGDGDPDAVWLSAAELLVPGTPLPDATAVDEMVALASTITEGPPGSDQARAAVDAYLLAVALLLRDRADKATDGTDRRAGAEELLRAAKAIPLDHPAAVVIMRSLGAFLSETRPLDGAVGAIAGGFADRLDSAIATGVSEPADLVALHALRCVCRAAEALRDLRRAAGTVPAEYPWLAAIAAAGQVAGSATA